MEIDVKNFIVGFNCVYGVHDLFIYGVTADKYFMKVDITGHTKGLGKAIFDELLEKKYHVQGFSRSNDFDINLSSNRDKIITEIQDYDVFINNAYSKDSQFEMLRRMIESWEGRKKIIININSKSIFAPTVPEFMRDYVLDKRQQYEFLQSRKFKAKPYVTDVILGLVETEMSGFFKARKLEPSVVAKYIVNQIEMHNHLYVQELVIDVPFQNWTEINSE
jgi:NAD(P)-dependent dehydrogenase (short-subunit alcohol dehydrogenase family)